MPPSQSSVQHPVLLCSTGRPNPAPLSDPSHCVVLPYCVPPTVCPHCVLQPAPLGARHQKTLPCVRSQTGVSEWRPQSQLSQGIGGSPGGTERVTDQSLAAQGCSSTSLLGLFSLCGRHQCGRWGTQRGGRTGGGDSEAERGPVQSWENSHSGSTGAAQRRWGP